MKKYLFLLCTALLCTKAAAQSFDEYFEDKTLRLDYIFSGNSQQQQITLDEACTSARWYGKRKRLAECPVEGNGQITVRTKDTGRVIYRNSFSTLFQEWLTYPEAKGAARSFENVFLVPMPRDTVSITLEQRNNRREVVNTYTHVFSPADILVREKRPGAVPYLTLQQPADTARCIRLAYVAEGYTEAEMEQFLTDAREANEALFAHEPFKTYKGRFQVVAVKSVSAESGPSIPHEHIWHNTALSSHFDTFYSQRYLTTLKLKRLHDVLSGIPYEHIIVLVNSDEYGGGGILNSYNLTSCHHRWFKPVVVHEFGHSFAGLADEYAYDHEQIPMYPHDVEPWEDNITTLAHFENKWQDMLPANTPVPTPQQGKNGEDGTALGVYEGAGYSLKGVYRPVPNCRMRTNTYPEFCPVCQRALRRVIEFYTE